MSDIIPDDEMPYMDNGERAEIILNALGVINRLNPMQIFEVSINYINNRVIERMRTMSTLKEKEELFFDIIGRYNSEYKNAVLNEYTEFSKKEKTAFMESVINDGIYVHIPPMWKERSLFDILTDLYKDYDWLKPQPVYVNKWGRKIQLANDIILGEQYMIKLKQSSKKGFSARSTGALSKRGVPEKSFKNKAHQDLYSTTPIRIGDQENINSLIGVDAETVAKLHMMYRSSVIGRRELGYKLLESNKPLKDFSTKSIYTNRNVEILQALLKSMGYKINYFGEDYVIGIESGEIKSSMLGDSLIIGTESEISNYNKRYKIITKYEEDVCFIGTNDEYQNLIDAEYEMAKLNDDFYVIKI